MTLSGPSRFVLVFGGWAARVLIVLRLAPSRRNFGFGLTLSTLFYFFTVLSSTTGVEMCVDWKCVKFYLKNCTPWALYQYRIPTVWNLDVTKSKNTFSKKSFQHHLLLGSLFDRRHRNQARQHGVLRAVRGGQILRHDHDVWRDLQVALSVMMMTFFLKFEICF